MADLLVQQRRDAGLTGEFELTLAALIDIRAAVNQPDPHIDVAAAVDVVRQVIAVLDGGGS